MQILINEQLVERLKLRHYQRVRIVAGNGDSVKSDTASLRQRLVRREAVLLIKLRQRTGEVKPDRSVRLLAVDVQQ